MHERKFDGETNCSGVVNFHAMQTSDEHAVYFRR